MAAFRLRGYAVGELLGRGASSEVWRARTTPGGDAVALKRLFGTTAEQVRRAHAEAALLTVLDHPNLVRLHAVVPTPDAAVLVLDLADGGSLSDLLAARGRLSPGEVITAIAPVAAALAYVHGHGIVHGDVSPANLLFTPAGVSLLADLGVARLTGDVGEAESTPGYVDPAVASGCVPTAVSDVFMLGAVTLHALTGSPLWPGISADDLLAAAQRADLSDVAGRLAVAGVPDAMAAVVSRALVVDPVRRCSAADFALDLRQSGTPVVVELAAGRSRADAVDGRVGRVRAVRAAAASHERTDVPKRRVVYDPRHAAPIGSVRTPAPVAERVPPPGLSRPTGSQPDAVSSPDAAPRWRAPRDVAPTAVPAGLPPTVAVRRARPVIARPRHPRVPRRMAVAALLALAVAAAVFVTAQLLPQRPPHGTAPGKLPGKVTAKVAATTDWAAALRTVDAARARVFATRDAPRLDRVYAPGQLRTADTALLARLIPPGCTLHGVATRFDRLRVTPGRGRAEVVARAAVGSSTLRCPGRPDRPVAAVAPRWVRIAMVSTAAGARISALRAI